MNAHNNRTYVTNNNDTPIRHNITDILCQPRYGFQRLYLESQAYLLGFSQQQTNEALQQALRYKLTQEKLNTDTLKSLETELLESTSTITTKSRELEQTRLKYYNAYRHDPHSNQDQEAVNLHSSLQDALQSDSSKQINNITIKLHRQTKDNPSNFWIAFDVAWLYFHIDQNMQKAEQQLIQAADYALQEKSPLANLILRYLAYTRLILGKNKEALESIQAVIKFSPAEQEYPQPIFESVQFNCLVEASYKQQIMLQKLIRHNPLYYIYTQTDELLQPYKNIQSLLLRFHIEKLEQIKKCVYEQWQASHFYQAELPEEFDKEALFNNNFQSYQALLSHQAYPVLCNVKNISRKITRQLDSTANKQLTMTQTRYVKKIIETQKQWKKVNQFGGVLLYTAVIISLASILLWVAATITEAPIFTNINWKELLPKLVIAVSLSAVIGLMLMRSTPPMNRKHFKQKQLLTNALEGKK
jgi:hypothetical protein